ncbi:hypothetical protein O3G_MSEX000122 [Manduca sexta]|nr:hypothetical protein O3G_MSEX000122 [Manduca sexta]KAG6438658.1 hypothetical protein O3G_MSEX000122 [Manduca sexta]
MATTVTPRRSYSYPTGALQNARQLIQASTFLTESSVLVVRKGWIPAMETPGGPSLGSVIGSSYGG